MIDTTMVKKPGSGGSFLNVDLEIYSRQPLDLVAAALGDAVDVLFVGKHGRRHLLAIELAGSRSRQTPDSIIMRLVEAIRKLPKAACVLWHGASERRFDLGYEAPSDGETLRLALKATTLAAIAEVNATLAVTVYRGATAFSSRRVHG